MSYCYLRTRLATDWPEERSFVERVIRILLFFIPRANPEYESKMHLVREWLIEFDQAGNPVREIALDEQGQFLFGGPNSRNYGFWPDTNMRLDDFEGEPFEKEVFLDLWERFGPDE